MKKMRKNKKDLYYVEAQSLYISGMELEQIKDSMPVSLRTLKSWQSHGHWERRKELVSEHPKFLGEALKGLVRQKVKELLGEKGLNPSSLDELNKIIILIERLEEQSWDERAAVVEVMGLFGDFVRRHVREREELRRLAKLVENFFEEMEGS
jgi:hypothetical protein